MAFLAGPASPLSSALTQLTRSAGAEPFGLDVHPVGLTPIQQALAQLAQLLHRFMGLVELSLRQEPPEPPPDDFMQGWGPDDLEAEG